MPRRTTTTSIPRTGSTGGHGSPGALIVLGLLLLGFALLVVTLQTQTNESFINGTQKEEQVIQAQWSIWLQIPRLMFGDGVPGPAIKSSELIGVIVGQGIELVYITLIASIGIATFASKKMGRITGTVITIILIFISIFDFYTDLVYGNVSPMAHIAFAIFCTFVIGFFPPWGFALIEHGWRRL